MSKKVTFQPYYLYNDWLWKINAGEDRPIYIHHLRKIVEQVHMISEHYSRVFTLFFDLHMTNYPVNNDYVTDFLRKLKTILKSEYGVKQFSYSWCREQENAETPHYHFMVMVNGSLINYPTKLIKLIQGVWGEITNGTVWFPENCYYMIKRGDGQAMAEVIYRASYQAKTRTKDKKNMQTKTYSTSRLKEKKKVLKNKIVTSAIETKTTPKWHKAATTIKKGRSDMTVTKLEILHQYLIERASSGVSVKAWCEENDLNYNTTRRYIKPSAAVSLFTMQKINSMQSVHTFGSYGDFIGTYEEALHCRTVLKQLLYEAYVKRILVRMQHSNLVAKINLVEDAINSEMTVEKRLSVYYEYANFQLDFDNKMELIESLSSLSFSLINKIKEVDKRIALGKTMVDNLKLTH